MSKVIVTLPTKFGMPHGYCRFVWRARDNTLQQQERQVPFADRWILSRLESGYPRYDIRLGTISVRSRGRPSLSVHLAPIYDRYLELIKPALQDKDSMEAQRTRTKKMESLHTLLLLLQSVP